MAHFRPTETACTSNQAGTRKKEDGKVYVGNDQEPKLDIPAKEAFPW